jgi:uncharacterized protein YabE (DUF348 family)
MVGVLLLAGVVHFTLQKHVTLVVDGRPLAIQTTSSNVRDLLTGEGISLAGDVRVEPPPTTQLADGMTVVVSPAPSMPAGFESLFSSSAPTVLQSPTDVGVWVMAGTGSGFANLASQLAESSFSAASVGTSPAVPVRVVVLGKVRDVLTNAGTAGELLSAMGITPGVHDRVRPSSSTPLHVGSTVVVDRVEILTRELRRSIPFTSRTLWTTELPIGQTQLVSHGMAGLAYVTERVVVVNGQIESTSVVGERVVRPAIDQLRRSGPASPSLPMEAPGGHVASGQATWYDPPWSGLTAASPWIPFGTHVTVTDVATGQTVIVVISDRGPFSPGRIIDLSPEAFSVLSPLGRGVLDVRISW